MRIKAVSTSNISAITRKLADYSLGLYAPADRPDWQAAVAAAPLSRADIPVIGYIPDILYAPELDYLGEIEPGLRATVRSASILAQRRMIAGGRGGRVVNVTSVHEHAPRVGAAPYCAAKGGLGLLTQVAALEPGQILRLDADTKSLIALECQDERIFWCRLAQSKSQFALVVEQAIDRQKELVADLVSGSPTR